MISVKRRFLRIASVEKVREDLAKRGYTIDSPEVEGEFFRAKSQDGKTSVIVKRSMNFPKFAEQSTIYYSSAKRKSAWIPITEKAPDGNNYVLLSYENFTLPDIGRYEIAPDGGGVFYPGDCDRSCKSFGLIVNAWMPLPEPYREDDSLED